MTVQIAVGDVLDTAADVLVSTANPWLNMSGGVNGAIRERCPDIQDELRRYLESIERTAIPAGSVVRTSAGTLPFSNIIHAVAIDPFYDSSVELVSDTLVATFDLARSLTTRSISLPTLATGYGPMSLEAFAVAFKSVDVERYRFEKVTIVVPSPDSADVIRSVFDGEV